MNKAITLMAMCALTSTGCKPPEKQAAAVSSSPQVDVEQVAKDYRHLRPMTTQPVWVSAGLATLCAGISQGALDRARESSGPHTNAEVMIYMNDAAAGAFARSENSFPVGSIVVKEKRSLGYSRPGATTIIPVDGVGGMIKRPAGYDAGHGDWEYFYFEDPAKIESGRIVTCVGCHSGTAKTDFVFGGWAKQ